MTTCDGNGDFDFATKARGVVEVFRVRMDRNEEISPPIGIIMGYPGFFANQGIDAIYVSVTEIDGRIGVKSERISGSRDLLSSFKTCLFCGMFFDLVIGAGIWISQWGYDGYLVSMFGLLWCICAGGGPGSDGAHATSYKAVVAQGIAYEKQGSSKQDGSFHPYKGKITRGYGDGSSMNGRDSGYGERRRGTQPRGVVPRGQHLATVAEGEQQLPDPSKLMLDAFKGAGKSSEEEAPIGVEAEGSGGHNKARKALMFEESSSVGHDLVSTGEGVELAGSLALKMQSEGDDAAQKLDERALHTQALDDANMILEGELLSDSELLLEEGEELEDWEHGELTDVMEEEDQAPLKKGAKVGIGGTSKKRLGPGFVSPRKKLLAKVAAKAGDKDAKRAAIGCWFSTLSCFLASPLGVTRVLFSCVAFVPLLVWMEYYKNKWLVWLHCGVRNLIEWRLCLSLNQDWYLAGDGWCYVTVLRWLTWFYFGSKRSTWEQGDGGMLGSWILGINRGGLFSLLGYMDLNGFSALCVWYGFGFQMVSMETLEAEVGGMRW
ncbi:hypothetical protein DY000_02041050 [Brassica cretica]|uniref:Uncharacterized protein n=1 Tax=Brassica cretica TaxID=69181 RepID=A0ABQ7BJU2_BRACR|nr:hypothetical protein DY000_02041050 [Brassica cretica]